MRASLSVDETRAQLLHQELLQRRNQVLTLQDVPRVLPHLAERWGTEYLGARIADLVGDGLITDDAYGRVFIHARAHSEPRRARYSRDDD